MKFFDFFAGIGGFRIGMEAAGHQCVGHCEIDKYANKSYEAMHNPSESEVFFEDVRTINYADMPECEVYCFGFPCQSFSITGKRGGFYDTRGTLFFEVMRLAKKRKPRILFAENVKGLLSHDGGGTFRTIIETMDELGYSVEWQLINSKHHGVPHNRERVYIIGHSREESAKQIFPIFGTSGKNSHVRQIGGVVRSTFAGPQEYRLYDKDYISPCLLTNSGGGKVPMVFDGDRIRKLTPRECFRLQGFPDEYFDRAREVNSDTQLYKQAGNSVTVNVIKEIAERL